MRALIASAAVAGALSMSISTPALAGPGEPAGANAGARAQTRAVTSCQQPIKVKVAQSSSSQSTTSTAFVDLVGSNVSFKVGGTVNTCVLVDFSAQAFAPNLGTLLMVRALRDGSLVSVDGEIQLEADSAQFSDAHAYNFLFTNVPPGRHSVKMQFRTFFAGDNVTINDFNMRVNFP